MAKRASQVAPVVRNLPANAGDKRDAVSFPGSGRSPGKGCGNTPPYSCLENPMDRGTWWAIVHGVAQSQTLLKWLSMRMGKNKETWQCLVLENNYLASFCKAEYLHVHTSKRNSRYMVTGRHKIAQIAAACQASLSSPSPRVCSNSGPLNRWCHPTTSSSAALCHFPEFSRWH